MGGDGRVGVRRVAEVVEQGLAAAGRLGGIRGVGRIRRVVAGRSGAPDGGARELCGDLVPVRVRGLRAAEGVVVRLVEGLPVGLVEAQLHVTGVRAGRQRARRGGEADLQVAVRGRGGVGQRAERARDVRAALDRPGTRESVAGARRVRLEVVADLHLAQLDRRRTGVAYFEPRFALVGGGSARAGAVLDGHAAAVGGAGGRREGDQGTAAEEGGQGECQTAAAGRRTVSHVSSFRGLPFGAGGWGCAGTRWGERRYALDQLARRLYQLTSHEGGIDHCRRQPPWNEGGLGEGGCD